MEKIKTFIKKNLSLFAISCIAILFAVAGILSCCFLMPEKSGSVSAEISGDWSSYIENYVETGKNDAGTTITLGNSEAYPIEISTAGQLAKIAYRFNSEHNTSSKYYKIVKPIDLRDHYWTPIGSESYPFYGTIDFNNNPIIGMTIKSNAAYLGFIGYGCGVTLKNAYFMNSVIEHTDTNDAKGSVGEFIGYYNNTSIKFKFENVTSKNCSIIINGNNPSIFNGVGGAVGGVSSGSGGTFKNCYFDNKIKAVNRVSLSCLGEIVGYCGSSGVSVSDTVTLSEITYKTNAISKGSKFYGDFVNDSGAKDGTDTDWFEINEIFGLKSQYWIGSVSGCTADYVTQQMAAWGWTASSDTTLTVTPTYKVSISYSVTNNNPQQRQFNSLIAMTSTATAGASGSGVEDEKVTINNTMPVGYSVNCASSEVSISNGVFTIPKKQVTIKTTFSANTYTIKNELNGGTIDPTPPTTATYDKKFTVNNPTKTGYTFAGWDITGMDSGEGITHIYDTNTTEETSIEKTKATSFMNLRATSGEVTFTAKWTANTYCVTLDKQGGTGGIDKYYYKFEQSSPYYYYTDSACTTPTTGSGTSGKYITIPEKTGYTFGGYFTSTNGGGTMYVDSAGQTVNNIYKTKASDTTLYAKWIQNTATIKRGTLTNVTKVSYGTSSSSITKELTTTGFTAKSNTNYYFKADLSPVTGYTIKFNSWSGWFSDTTNASSAHSFTSNGDTFTVNASATKTANKYTIVYNGNGNTGGSTASSTHTYDVATALTPNGFTKTGYTFAGWAKSASGTVVYSDKQSVKNLASTQGATVNLYAKWTANEYPITYSGILPVVTASYVTNDTSSISVDGCAVVKPSSGAGEYSWTINTLKTGDNVPTMGKVYLYGFHNYMTDGERYRLTIEVKSSRELSNVKMTIEAGYYVYKTYNTTTSYETKFIDFTYNYGSDYKSLTFNAQFKQDDVFYVKNVRLSKLATYDQVCDKNPVLTKTGYTFNGYYTSETGGSQLIDANGNIKYVSGITNSDREYVKTTGTTVYPRWTANKYTVTFDRNIAYSSSDWGYQKPDTASVFKSWSVSNNTITVQTNGQGGWEGRYQSFSVTSGTTYTISFDYKMPTLTAQYDSSVAAGRMRAQILSRIPTSTDENCSNILINTTAGTGYYEMLSGASGTATMTFEATATTQYYLNLQFGYADDLKDLSFTFSNFKFVGEKITVTYDSTYGTLPTPTKDYYKFNGWWTASSGGTQVTDSTKVAITANQTLYAHWTANKITINYNLNGGTAASGSDLPSSHGWTYNAYWPSGLYNPTTSRVWKTGYTADNNFWNTNSSGSGKNVSYRGIGENTSSVTYTNVSFATECADAAGKLSDFKTGDIEITLYVKWIANTYTITKVDYIPMTAGGFNGVGTFFNGDGTYNLSKYVGAGMYSDGSYVYVNSSSPMSQTATLHEMPITVNQGDEYAVVITPLKGSVTVASASNCFVAEFLDENKAQFSTRKKIDITTTSANFPNYNSIEDYKKVSSSITIGSDASSIKYFRFWFWYNGGSSNFNGYNFKMELVKIKRSTEAVTYNQTVSSLTKASDSNLENFTGYYYADYLCSDTKITSSTGAFIKDSAYVTSDGRWLEPENVTVYGWYDLKKITLKLTCSDDNGGDDVDYAFSMKQGSIGVGRSSIGGNGNTKTLTLPYGTIMYTSGRAGYHTTKNRRVLMTFSTSIPNLQDCTRSGRCRTGKDSNNKWYSWASTTYFSVTSATLTDSNKLNDSLSDAYVYGYYVLTQNVTITISSTSG